jgi:hypothetical protein
MNELLSLIHKTSVGVRLLNWSKTKSFKSAQKDKINNAADFV